MKKIFLITVIGLATMMMNAQETISFYSLKAQTIDGKDFDFSTLKGKKVLLVNTASKCGHTPQYAKLEELHKQYGNDNFVIIGFPANNFLGQEPGSNEEIIEFCRLNYGVTFQMMSKISVKGKDVHPVYKWLTSKSENGVMDSDVKWNFQKYLVDENGTLVDVLQTKEDPMSDKILTWLKN